MAAVTRIHELAPKEQTVSAGEPDAPSVLAEQPGEQAGGVGDPLAAGDADHRDAPVLCGGRTHVALGAGVWEKGVGHLLQGSDGCGDVEGPVGIRIYGGQQQIPAEVEGGAGDGLVPGPYRYLVDTPPGGAARPAETARHARQVLQFQGDVLQDVCGPGPLREPAQETTALPVAAPVLHQAGKQGGQTLRKSRDGVRWAVLQIADIDPGLQHRAIGPDVGSAQVDEA